MAAKNSKPKGVELAAGYVSLYVDASNVGDQIEDELEVAGKKGGEKAGEAVEKELGKSGKESGKKAGEDFGKELSERAGTAAKAAGVAAGAAIVVGLHQAAQQADLVGTMQAQLGTTPQYAKEIAETAANAYNAGWGESLDVVGKTAAQVGQIVNEMGDGSSIEDLTIKATALASQFEQDTGAITNSAAQLVRTGMAGTLDEAFDLITRGFQSNTKLGDDFLDSIDEYGVQFKELGLNGAEGLGIFNEAMKSGARDSDYVSDALKEYVIRGKEMKEETAEAFTSIGLDGAKMQKAIAGGGPAAKQALIDVTNALRGQKDPVLQNAAAVAIFGAKAEDLQGSLFAIDPSKATQGLGDLAGTADTFVTNSMGMEQQLTSIHRTLTDGLAAALTPLLPQLQQLATVGLHFFQWLGANPVVTQIILGIGAALGVAAAAQWAFNAAQLANPTTWIILGIMAAIALVIGIIWLLASNWDTITQGMAVAGSLLHITLAHAWNGIIHGINGVLHALNGVARFFEYILSLGGLLGDWNWGEIGMIGLVDIPDLTDGKTSIPGLANGGTVTGSGTTLVGEYGPELLNLPKGSSVVPLDHPAANAGASRGAAPVINITTHNPVAEKTSETVKKAGQYVGVSLV